MPNNTDSANLFSLEDLAVLEGAMQPRKRINRKAQGIASDDRFRSAVAKKPKPTTDTPRTWSLGKIHPDWTTKSNYLTKEQLGDCLLQMQNQIRTSKEIPEANKARAIEEVQRRWRERLVKTQDTWQNEGFSNDDLMNFCYDANSVFGNNRVVPQDEAYRRLYAIEQENEQSYHAYEGSDQQTIIPRIRKAWRGSIQQFMRKNQAKSLTVPQINLLAKVAEAVRLLTR